MVEETENAASDAGLPSSGSASPESRDSGKARTNRRLWGVLAGMSLLWTATVSAIAGDKTDFLQLGPQSAEQAYSSQASPKKLIVQNPRPTTAKAAAQDDDDDPDGGQLLRADPQ